VIYRPCRWPLCAAGGPHGHAAKARRIRCEEVWKLVSPTRARGGTASRSGCLVLWPWRPRPCHRRRVFAAVVWAADHDPCAEFPQGPSAKMMLGAQLFEPVPPMSLVLRCSIILYNLRLAGALKVSGSERPMRSRIPFSENSPPACPMDAGIVLRLLALRCGSGTGLRHAAALNRNRL
jgi:hypothetical protein